MNEIIIQQTALYANEKALDELVAAIDLTLVECDIDESGYCVPLDCIYCSQPLSGELKGGYDYTPCQHVRFIYTYYDRNFARYKKSDGALVDLILKTNIAHKEHLIFLIMGLHGKHKLVKTSDGNLADLYCFEKQGYDLEELAEETNY